jgi:hypothetical protein
VIKAYVDQQDKIGQTLPRASGWHHICARVIISFVKNRSIENVRKGNVHPITGHQWPRGGVEVYLYSFSTTKLGGGGWPAPRPGRFTPGKDQVPIVQEAGWAPGSFWTGTKNIAPTGIPSPDRPTRSQSLYRLSYPAHEYVRSGAKKYQTNNGKIALCRLSCNPQSLHRKAANTKSFNFCLCVSSHVRPEINRSPESLIY